MGMNGYMDEQLDVMGDGLFDDIDEFFNFSNDDEISQVEGSDVDSAHLPSLPNVIAAPFTSSNGEGSQVVPIPEEAKICDELNTSEDWINNFLDENPFYDTDFNTTAAIAVKDDRIFKEEPQFQSLSPVSVLEPSNIVNSENKDIISSSSSSSSSSSFSSITTNNNSSSSSSSNNNNNNEADAFSVVVVPVGPTTMSVPARARSKRPRHVAIPILPPEAPPAIPTLLLPECESFIEESCPIVLAPPPMKKKKKMGLPAVAAGANQEEAPAPRKCLHCGIQKTPQWRAGPMGPKTLCNACGVRYKSGRLFPEYRPAASPTFVPAIHSNSHKKVVELRNKACQEKAANGMPSPEYPAAKNCDLLEYIRRRD